MLPFSYARSIPRQVVESRVKSVLWQEDDRVALVEIACYILTEKRWSAKRMTSAAFRSRHCMVSNDHCHRPSAIVWQHGD